MNWDLAGPRMRVTKTEIPGILGKESSMIKTAGPWTGILEGLIIPHAVREKITGMTETISDQDTSMRVMRYRARLVGGQQYAHLGAGRDRSPRYLAIALLILVPQAVSTTMDARRWRV